MIIRSEIPFLKQMKRDISRIFSDFSEATGVAGAIAFQTTVKFIDIPIPKLEEQNGKGIVIWGIRFCCRFFDVDDVAVQFRREKRYPAGVLPNFRFHP